MNIDQQILIMAAKTSGWCFCHCKPDNELEKMNLTGEKLETLINLIKDILNVEISSSVYSKWTTLKDIIDYVLNNQQKA